MGWWVGSLVEFPYFGRSVGSSLGRSLLVWVRLLILCTYGPSYRTMKIETLSIAS